MIKLSKKEDYAMILIYELAKNYNKRIIPLSEIAKKYSISVLFLRNLTQNLKIAGIIKAVEGKAGGFYLCKNPESLKVGEILSAFSENNLLTCCPTTADQRATSLKCTKQEYCLTGNVWRKLNKEFIEKISGLSLYEFLSYNKN